jgi:hypothetical protein
MNIPESQNLSPISYALSRKAKRSASAAGMPYVPLAPIRPRPKRGTRGPWFPSGLVGIVFGDMVSSFLKYLQSYLVADRCFRTRVGGRR